MTEQLDLRDLHYFETIATLGHVGKAAERLHRSQPALTGCIRRIESTLGTALFEKEGRNIRLTPAGELLLERARNLLISADDIVKEFKDYSGGLSGQVRIGLVPTAAHHMLLPLTKLLSKDYPNLQLKLIIGQSDFLNKLLKERELDLIIGLESDLGDSFEFFPIFEDTMVVVANSSHEIFKNPAVEIEDLLKYKWVLAPTSVTSRKWLDQNFELQGLPKPDVQIETNLLLMIPSMIMQTDLLSFISRLNLKQPSPDVDYIREVKVKETTMQRWYKVIHRKDGYLPPASRRLRDILIEQGRDFFENN